MRNRIKECRTAKNLTQEQLANALGLQKSAIAKYESGRVTNIKQSILIRMAEILVCSPAYLMGWENAEEMIDSENFTGLAPESNHFQLQINDDGMAPAINRGDTVLVHSQNPINSGDLIIVILDNAYPTCRRLIKYTEGISLIPLNTSYSPDFFSNEVLQEVPIKILGKVVESRHKW